MSNLFRGVQHAKVYQKYRPEHPAAVYGVLLNFLDEWDSRPSSQGEQPILPSDRKKAIDIGCGTGISTLPLCDHFKAVVGVDISEAQIEEARKASVGHPNVTYRVGLAHKMDFQEDGGVDLITVAQALHWLDRPKFYQECHRVLRPGGVLAAYGYGVPRLKNQDAHNVMQHFHDVTLEGFWDAGRRHIVDCLQEIYKDFSVAFPTSKRVDNLVLEKTYSLNEFLGYLQSWSAYQVYKSQLPEAEDPLVSIAAKLRAIMSTTDLNKPVAAKNSDETETGAQQVTGTQGSGDDAKAEELFATSPVFILLGRKTLSN